MNAVTRLFARTQRKPAAAPVAAKAKRTRANAIGPALSSALEGCRNDDIDMTCRTVRILEDLLASTDDAGVLKAEAELPALPELENALSELKYVELPTATLRTLTRFRDSLARSQAAAASGRTNGHEPAQYLTIPQSNARDAALIKAFAVALNEVADGCRDAFFNSGRCKGRLLEIAEDAAPGVQQVLQQLVDAMSGRAESYGVDRSRERSNAPRTL